MAHRLDAEIHGMHKTCLEEISKAKGLKSKKPVKVEHLIQAGSRDDAVRARHKHLALAKLLEKDGYSVSFVPDGDEIPKGKYVKSMSVKLVISLNKPEDEVND